MNETRTQAQGHTIIRNEGQFSRNWTERKFGGLWCGITVKDIRKTTNTWLPTHMTNVHTNIHKNHRTPTLNKATFPCSQLPLFPHKPSLAVFPVFHSQLIATKLIMIRFPTKHNALSQGATFQIWIMALTKREPVPEGEWEEKISVKEVSVKSLLPSWLYPTFWSTMKPVDQVSDCPTS